MHTNYAEPWRVTLVDTGADTMTGGRLSACCATSSDDDVLLHLRRRRGRRRHRRADRLPPRAGTLATVTAVQPPGRFGALDSTGRAGHGVQGEAAGRRRLDQRRLLRAGRPRSCDYIEGDDTSGSATRWSGLARDGQLCAFRHTGFWQPMDTLRDKITLENCGRRASRPGRSGRPEHRIRVIRERLAASDVRAR